MTLDRFERGPIHIVFDMYSNADVPEGCHQDLLGLTHFSVLANLVLDDAELATHLNQTYGAPVRLASFGEGRQDVGAGDFHEMSWTIDGHGTSTVAIYGPKENSPAPMRFERIFWMNGAGLTMLELAPEQERAMITNMFGHGTFASPMHFASDTQGRFVGDGDWYPKQRAEGDFTRYADTLCELPIG